MQKCDVIWIVIQIQQNVIYIADATPVPKLVQYMLSFLHYILFDK